MRGALLVLDKPFVLRTNNEGVGFAMTKTNDPKVGAAQKELRSAFDDLIADLQAARDTIDDPQFFPPAAT